MEKTSLNKKYDIKTILASGVVTTYLAMLLLGVFTPVSVNGLQEIVMLVIGYYFGSSDGSKTKDTIFKTLNDAK